MPATLPMAQAQRAVAVPARAACVSAVHVRLEIDPELRAHLRRWYTEEDLNTILSAIVRPPPAVTLRVNTTQTSQEALVRAPPGLGPRGTCGSRSNESAQLPQLRDALHSFNSHLIDTGRATVTAKV